ncbi:MAG: Ig-like domain-containing protein [Bdellovibrionales bacterium]|nr:Ig-like domain-containing protein [Bdellovibrionales bacterium]
MFRTFCIYLLLLSLTGCLKKGSDFSFVEGSTDNTQESQPGNSAIEFDPVSWDFGPHASYSGSESKVITISNKSKNNVLITAINGENDHFTVKSDSCSKSPVVFKPNDACTITIEFSPQEPGNLSTTFNVLYTRVDSEDSLQKSLGLSGQGVSPINFGGIQSIDNISHNSMRLNWNASTDAKSFMVFSVDNQGSLNYQKTISNTGGNVTSTVMDSLTPSSSYTWRVRAIDALGNQETNNIDETANTLVNNAPSLNPITLSNIYTGQVVDANDIDANNAALNNDIDSDGDQISYTCRWDQSINSSMDGSAQSCSNLINEGGGSPTFGVLNGRLSGWTPQHAMAGQNIEFEIVGQDPYGASDSIYFSTTILAGTPQPPTVTGIYVTSPVNENNPVVAGVTQAGFTIKLYNNAGCTGSDIGSGTSNGAGNFAVTATVPDNAITQIYATATNSIGNESGCSNSSVTIVEDSAPPSPTLVTGSMPASPSTDLTPQIVGTTESNATVKVFSDATCSTLVTTSSADNNGDFSIAVSVSAFSSTIFKVTATDASGNESNCSSTSVTYESYAIATGAAVLSSTEAVSGSNMNPSVASSLRWSESYYDNDYYSHSLTSNNEQVQVLQNGSYLLTLNVPLTQGTADYGRETPKFEVFVNNIKVPTALAESTYIRNASGHEESSAHLSVLLPDLTASDVIDVRASSGAPDLSTVLISNKAKLYLEFIDTSTRSVFSATTTRTNNSTNLNQSTAYPLLWGSNKKDSSVYTHNNALNAENITIEESGDYLVFVNLPVQSNVQRASVSVRVKLDGSTVTGGSAQQGYIRADPSTGNDKASVHWSGLVTNVNAGQTLTITTQQLGAGGTVNVTSSYEGSIYIEKIDTSSNALSLTSSALSSGVNLNPATESTWSWSSLLNNIYDNSVFSHSTSSSNHQITVLSSGDYLLVYNDSITSSVQRSNNIISVKVNGAVVDGAQVKSHYIRSSGGHNHSSGSMVIFLRNLQSNDVITLTSQAEALGGTVSAFDPSLLTIIKKR